jgi:hypothetical protein
VRTDKDIAMRVVDQLEEYYLRCTLLETILDASKVPGWRQMFAEVFPSPEARASVKRQFEPVRERILDAPDLTTAVREMLGGLPKTGPTE